MKGVIVAVCAAFSLILSEVKAENVCSYTKGMPEAVAILSLEAAGQVCSQTNESVYLGANVNHNAMSTCPSRSTGAYATHGAASGSIPLNYCCTADQAFPSSSNSGCLEPRYSR